MPNAIGPTGLTIASIQELLANLTAAYQAIYGADINLDSDSPDGQMENIFVQSSFDVESFIEQVNAMFDPDQAVGVILDSRVAINGIQRQGGTYTITNIAVVVSGSVTLQGLDLAPNAPFTVADNAGNQFYLITSASPSVAGTYTYAFRAANTGAVLTTQNTITTIVSIVLGVTSVNNPTVASVTGVNEETDAALKIRRQKAVALGSQGFFSSLYAALTNIPGVIDAFIYENDTGSTDGDGVPGHSIWVIVEGTPAIPLATVWNSVTTYSYGQIASSGIVNYISWANNNQGNDPTIDTVHWGVYNPIAQAIYLKRNAGCGMFGAQMYTVTQVDGSPFVIDWDVVTSQTLYVSFVVVPINPARPVNYAGILAQLPSLLNATLGVNGTANINDVSTLVQQIDPNALVTFVAGSQGLGLSATGPWSPTLIPSTKAQQFVTATQDIIIAPIQVLPASPVAVVHGNTVSFSAAGGFSTLSISISVNNSGGALSAIVYNAATQTLTATYTAGATPDVADTILVTDTQSRSTSVTVLVS